MRLFEAILDANQRALAGDAHAGLHPADYADALPVAALTCIDARLNSIFPDALALPKEQFIWLRNAGNIITSPMSSTMRSLALACAIKGGKEIAIIGHTDCQVCKTSTMKLTDAFKALGVERGGLPENLQDFFGLFASERQNVMKAVDFVRQSPLIGPKIPVHGLMVDVNTGKLEWVVNGYQALESLATMKADASRAPDESQPQMGNFAAFNMGVMTFPDGKIGEVSSAPGAVAPIPPPPIPSTQPPPPPPVPARPTPPPLKVQPAYAPQIPVPPRIRGR
ncbi:MAG TPA: carbonic anhydrase [Verrucomicrobiae bacterium]|jgi:carbonic anhydrase|nr:carbonic anhydrase [Verrucomicrobiae bacterium]